MMKEMDKNEEEILFYSAVGMIIGALILFTIKFIVGIIILVISVLAMLFIAGKWMISDLKKH